MLDTSPVLTIQEFKKKYCHGRVHQLIGDFIQLSRLPPENREQGQQLVRALGIMTADLETALRNVE